MRCRHKRTPLAGGADSLTLPLLPLCPPPGPADLNFRLGLPSVPAAPTNGDVDGEVWTAADVLRRVHDASLGRLENWRERAYRPLLLGTRGAFAMGEEEGADKADREHRFEELLSRDELREVRGRRGRGDRGNSKGLGGAGRGKRVL